MASTTDEIELQIRNALSKGHRGKLLERGLARSMIWQDGQLPPDAPKFSANLTYDLLSYGYSILSLSLRLKEQGGDEVLCREGIVQSALSIQHVTYNGDPEYSYKPFHDVICASAFHLSGYSAKAYSLVNKNLDNENLSDIEEILCLLLLRRFDELTAFVERWKSSGKGTEDYLVHRAEEEFMHTSINQGNEAESEEHTGVEFMLSVIDLAITDNYMSSISEFVFALETGIRDLVDSAKRRLQNTIVSCSELNLVSQWWIIRITIYLIGDLWRSSFHEVIPLSPSHQSGKEWEILRRYFIDSLYKRKRSEIELWPSQVEGATRSVDDLDNLICSLPTSAGKTRIAELCILRALALGKRVLYIAPLRALSAQVEKSLSETFGPLGKSISTLYGSIGTSDFEQNVIRTHDIVVGTPEKLDFALRNDSTLIDDVGLVILDEGHMIGMGDREIRYEVQIQRLLKRADADVRRIVCLSAILPDGEQLEDFVSWLRKDKEGNAVSSSWRPTDLRFGEIVWRNDSADLRFMLEYEKSFVPKYIQSSISAPPQKSRRKKAFPAEKAELTLATGWKLTDDNHTVLIYCPQKSSVNSLAARIIKLNKQGYLDSVLEGSRDKIEKALILGEEWLGVDHPIVNCLKIGVGVHHGSLPTPFRIEMENLLRKGILKITVSSPTLAQGLNLTATAIIFHSLYRGKEIIKSTEFKNITGRAGRAFIETHGIILYPIFSKYEKEHSRWTGLVESTSSISLESGLLLLVQQLLNTISCSIQSLNIDEWYEYVLNNSSWSYPSLEGESKERKEANESRWNANLANLDTALLSLIGNEDIPIERLDEKLQYILRYSLWKRSLARFYSDAKTMVYECVLSERAKYIWKQSTPLQRKGYFLAGIGLETGRKLDDNARNFNSMLASASWNIEEGNLGKAIEVIEELASRILSITPFTPVKTPSNWKVILSCWLQGKSLSQENIGKVDDALQFIEDGLIFRLSWGFEAIRVRAGANNDRLNSILSLTDCKLSLVTECIERGTLNRSAVILLRAGFSSRIGAIRAIESTDAKFTKVNEFEQWLYSDKVSSLTDADDWPTTETSELWKEFVNDYRSETNEEWDTSSTQVPVLWNQTYAAEMGTPVRLRNPDEGDTLVYSSTGDKVGRMNGRYALCDSGIYRAVVNGNPNFLDITYSGPRDQPFTIRT